MNKILKDNNIKTTEPREKILDLFLNNDELSIQDLKMMLKSIDLSTIYRTVELFIEHNIIIKLVDDGRIVYILKDKHNHYLKCVKCHKKIILDKCPFDENNYDGFKILRHTLMIEGICNKCQKNIKC